MNRISPPLVENLARAEQFAVLWTKAQPTVAAYISAIVRDFEERRILPHCFACSKSFRAVSASQTLVIWKPDLSILNLNTLIDPASGWTLTTASKISDTGWIAGTGSYDPDGPTIDPDGAGPLPETGTIAAYSRFFSLYVPEASWYKLGDFNFDGIVNNLDIQPMLNALTNAEAYYASIPGLNSYDAQWFQTLVGDLNDDNLFNNLDIQAMLDYLTSGQSLTAAGSGVIFLGGDALEVTAVPEPTTWAALGLTLLGGLAYRRRQRTAS
jgi:hypothetical protein